MAARKLRHKFLANTARENKISTVALAHHADDQVELFFLRLFRGAGGEGLGGMKWRSRSPADQKISLVRPLLSFSKAEILEFARENKIAFRNDATNYSSDFLRNRIRNELLPLIREKYQPAVDKTVLRAMEIAGAEAGFASATASAWLVKPQWVFEKLPVAVQRKVLQRQLTELGVVSDFELVEQLRQSPGKLVSVNSTLSVVCDKNGKVQNKRLVGRLEESFKPDELKLKLSQGAGRAEFGGMQFRLVLKKHDGLLDRLPRKLMLEFFDADKVGDEIILRHWRAGDRFQPIGMQSAVKLQDLFVNAKIPAEHRRSLVVATTLTGGVFWVEGLRIGEKFKLTEATEWQLRWDWSKIAA